MPSRSGVGLGRTVSTGRTAGDWSRTRRDEVIVGTGRVGLGEGELESNSVIEAESAGAGSLTWHA